MLSMSVNVDVNDGRCTHTSYFMVRVLPACDSEMMVMSVLRHQNMRI